MVHSCLSAVAHGSLFALTDKLRAWPMPAGSYVIKRYGEPGAREERVELAPPG